MERKDVREIREFLGDVLKTIGDDMGLSITLDGSARYDDAGAYFKLTVARPGAKGEAVDKLSIDFVRYARSFGLRPEDLGRTFEYAGKTLVLAGIAPKSTRFPIIARRPDGKLVKVPEYAVRSLASSRAGKAR